jgi:hypothetical protein
MQIFCRLWPSRLRSDAIACKPGSADPHHSDRSSFSLQCRSGSGFSLPDPDPVHLQSDRNLRPLVYRLPGFHLSLHALIVNAHGLTRLHFEPLNLLNFYFNADPAPAFHSNADPDPASQNNADPELQPRCKPFLLFFSISVFTASFCLYLY